MKKWNSWTNKNNKKKNTANPFYWNNYGKNQGLVASLKTFQRVEKIKSSTFWHIIHEIFLLWKSVQMSLGNLLAKELKTEKLATHICILNCFHDVSLTKWRGFGVDFLERSNKTLCLITSDDYSDDNFLYICYMSAEYPSFFMVYSAVGIKSKWQQQNAIIQWILLSFKRQVALELLVDFLLSLTNEHNFLTFSYMNYSSDVIIQCNILIYEYLLLPGSVVLNTDFVSQSSFLALPIIVQRRETIKSYANSGYSFLLFAVNLL